MRPHLGDRVENLAAIEKSTAALRAPSHGENGGLLRRPGKKDHTIPRICVERTNFRAFESWSCLGET